jgi:hypothetical protein
MLNYIEEDLDNKDKFRIYLDLTIEEPKNHNLLTGTFL